MTIDWRQLLLDKITDHGRELDRLPTADHLEDWSDRLAGVIADVIDLKRASEVDTEEQGYGYGV